jgi:hypothetical protein
VSHPLVNQILLLTLVILNVVKLALDLWDRRARRPLPSTPTDQQIRGSGAPAGSSRTRSIPKGPRTSTGAGAGGPTSPTRAA